MRMRVERKGIDIASRIKFKNVEAEKGSSSSAI